MVQKPLNNKTFIEKIQEMPPLAVSSGTMEWNNTGSWRYIRPVYENKVPPCNHNCPCSNDIVGFLSLIQEQKFKEGWELIRQTNPFPGVCGRVCYHPCEKMCNRGHYDQPIAIRSLERFLADAISDSNAIPPVDIPKRNEEVAVIGAGPSGLSCAYHLARNGYRVTIFEAKPEPGGLLRYGIPQYRLPKEVLDREIRQILSFGILLKVNQGLGIDFTWEDLQKFQSVFLSVGASGERRLEISGENHSRVLSGIHFLSRVNAGQAPDIGPGVVVIGGGNTAIDVARASVRLGKKVTVAAIESEVEMPAHPEEIQDARTEGVKFLFGMLPTGIRDGDRTHLALHCVPVRLGEPDARGWRPPIPLNGHIEIIDTDTIITAIGQEPDLSVVPEGCRIQFGKLIVDSNTLMARPGVFAGGDVVLGAPNTVSGSIGMGHTAAGAIHRYIQNLKPLMRAEPKITEFKDLNSDYFSHEERIQIDYSAPIERLKSFNEVEQGIAAQDAVQESKRCFQCGTCTQCDNCLIFCPDLAIIRKNDGSGYDINYHHCKGCGICIEECPRDALSIEKEVKWKYRT